MLQRLRYAMQTQKFKKPLNGILKSTKLTSTDFKKTQKQKKYVSMREQQNPRFRRKGFNTQRQTKKILSPF